MTETTPIKTEAWRNWPPLRVDEQAFYSTDKGKFLLPYEAVRTAADPDPTLLVFFTSPIGRPLSVGKWDRAALEADPRRWIEKQRTPTRSSGTSTVDQLAKC